LLGLPRLGSKRPIAAAVDGGGGERIARLLGAAASASAVDLEGEATGIIELDCRERRVRAAIRRT